MPLIISSSLVFRNFFMAKRIRSFVAHFPKSGLLIVIICLFLASSAMGQNVASDLSETVADSGFKQFSLDELERFRTHYTREITRLEVERADLLEQGIRDAELFLAHNPNSETADRVMMRLAELYYEKTQADFQEDMSEFDRLYALYERDQIDQPPVEPSKDLSSSLHMYALIIEEYPKSTYVDDAFYNIGFLLEESGHLDSAFTFYQKTLAEFPNTELKPDLLMRIGEYYFNPPNNQVEVAIEYYKQILEFETSPRYDEALYRLGWSYYRLSQYDRAISYFTLLADDVYNTRQFDPERKYTNPSLVEEAVEYIGLSFLEKGGPDAAINYLREIGGRPYGVDILERMGDAYMREKEDYALAIRAYELLLEEYPDVGVAPQVQNNIVLCLRRQEEDALAFLARDLLYTRYHQGTEWWEKNKDEQVRETAYILTETALRDNISWLLNSAQEEDRQDIYYQAVVESEKYLRSFPSDSSTPLIHWNMALTLDTKLDQQERAYDEYLKISNLYWDSQYQRFAAKNAVALARDAAMNAIAAAEEQAAKEEPVSIAELRKEAELEGTEGFNFRERMKLQPTPLSESESRLATAYDNFIKLFPHDIETPLFLANAGAVYYRHNQFRNALKYFKTLLMHFPGSDQVAQARYAIMESYFGRGDFRSSEIISRKIIESNANEEIRSRARRRLAESIFLSAEVLAEAQMHLKAGNEYRRMVKEAPRSDFADLALFNAGLEYDKAQEYNRAIETYTFLLASHPNSGYVYDAQNNLAFDYAEVGDYRNAALVYERLATIHPDTSRARDALYNSSLYFAQAEDWEGGIRVNKLFLQRFPQDEAADDLAFEIAMFYRELNELESAHEFFLEFTQRYPASPYVIEAHFRRGNYYKKQDEPYNAIIEYQKALLKSEEFDQKDIERNDYFAAESEFALAQVKLEQFHDIQFTLPEAELNRKKERKKDLLLEIVRHLRGVTEYGTFRVYEASYLIGQTYQDFAQTWADQQLPEMETTRKIVAKKEVNDAARELYERSATSYRSTINGLTDLLDTWAATLSQEEGLDPTMSLDSLSSVTQDSILRIGMKWIDRSKNRLTQVNYEIADISLETAHAVLQAPIPEGLGDFPTLVYRKRVVDLAIAPQVTETQNVYLRNLAEADSFGIESQWVELSKEKLVSTEQMLADFYAELARNGIELLHQKFDNYGALVFSDMDFGAVVNDLQTISDDIANLLEFSDQSFDSSMTQHDQNLQLVSQLNLEERVIQTSSDSMLATALDFALLCDSLSIEAKQYGDRARDMFLKTTDPLLEEGLFTFESNYFALRDLELSALEYGYEMAKKYNNESIFAKNITLQLVRFAPEQYAVLVDLEIKESMFITDTTWRTSPTYFEGWTLSSFDQTAWQFASIIPGVTSELGQAIWCYTRHDTVVVVDSVETVEVVYEPVNEAFFRKEFAVNGLPVACEISFVADEVLNLYFNGDLITRIRGAAVDDSVAIIDLSDLLVDDKNTIALEVRDDRIDKKGLRAQVAVKSLPGWREKVDMLRPELASDKVKQELLIEKGRIP
ncbi:tetratricopeptide repeat protein [candidate division KSB1 bacterium]|nr:tetratricopeptide repeat protein [candidate division KSB1 bacterium]